MQMKERVETILGKFLERNKEYAVHVYLRNLISENILADFSISDWRIEENDRYYKIVWDGDYTVIYYPDVVKCYEETDKFGQQSVHIFLGGIRIEFECCGERIEK